MTYTRVFNRKPGCATSIRTHIRALAHRVLDRAKAGDCEALPHIEWALRVTGDLPSLNASQKESA